MCEERGRQVGGQTDAAEGRAMDRRRDERCDESRERRHDRLCAPRHLGDSPPTERR